LFHFSSDCTDLVCPNPSDAIAGADVTFTCDVSFVAPLAPVIQWELEDGSLAGQGEDVEDEE